MQQYFIEKHLKINETYFFNEIDIHHIKNVLRLNKNEVVRLVSENEAYFAKIAYKNQLPYAVVFDIDTFKRDLSCKITLIQALIKIDKFELILQKASELGVSKVIPLYTSRVNVKKEIIKNKKERFEKIVCEASKQCKRDSIMKVTSLIDIKDCINYKSELNFIAYEENYKDSNNILNYLKKNKDITIVIGPEGGFNKEEVKLLTGFGYHNINLGKRILRAETASIYALSIISAINEV